MRSIIWGIYYDKTKSESSKIVRDPQPTIRTTRYTWPSSSSQRRTRQLVKLSSWQLGSWTVRPPSSCWRVAKRKAAFQRTVQVLGRTVGQLLFNNTGSVSDPDPHGSAYSEASWIRIRMGIFGFPDHPDPLILMRIRNTALNRYR